MEDCRLPLVVILGPTAAGKTDISIQLANRIRGEIVSADSRLFYLGMDIGTAKPTLAERCRVRHHLIDVARPDQVWSLAVFQNEAKLTIAEIQQRGCMPMLVGGTGQYIRAVIQDWQIPQVHPDPRLRLELSKWAEQIGYQDLHDRLAILDPEAARAIDARNLRRTVRALEVILSSGRRFSDQRQSGRSPYRLLQIGLIRPREELYARIDARIDSMLASGLIDEVISLLEAGYPSDLPPFSAIGYRQIIAYIEGRMTLEEAVADMKRSTRMLVRRQANWFKLEDPEIHWLRVDEWTVDTAFQLIEAHLLKSS